MNSSTRRARFVLPVLLVLAAAMPASAMDQNSDPRSVFGADRPTFGARAPQNETVPNQVIVKYEEGTGPAARAAVRGREDLSKKKSLDLINAEVVRVESGSVADAIEDLEADPNVEYAEPDRYVYPTDIRDEERFAELWGLHNTGQPIRGKAGVRDVDVDALQAASVTRGDEDLVVAVIDDGVDFSHPDLQGHSWVNEGEVPNNNRDDDRNGYIDDVNGYDFGNDDNTVHDTLEDGHGTHVAGTIAASADGDGVAGVASEVEIMAVKFLGPLTTLSTAVEAIEYASDNGAKISNNSWGYIGTPSKALKQAIERSGMLFVAAAGNEGINNDTGEVIFEGEPPWRAYPAAYDSPNILSVAAVKNTGEMPRWTNYGKKSVDISAPGVNVLSTVPSTPAESGAALSTVGTNGGQAVTAGFGIDEVSGDGARNRFVKSALGSLGHCVTGACNAEMHKVLLVDDDLSSEFEEFGVPNAAAPIAKALRSVPNVDLDVVEAGGDNGPSLRKLDDYEYVIWATGWAFFSGSAESEEIKKTLTFEDQNALTRYLNGGGNLILTGMDALFGIEKNAFVTDTLGLEVRSDYPSAVFEGAPGTAFAGDSYDLSNSPFAISFFHDIVAPAGPNATPLGDARVPEGYAEYASGTSMVAPHATGVAALAASRFPGLLDRPAALKRLVAETGEPAPETRGKTATGDMVNALAAVTNSRPSITDTAPRGSVGKDRVRITATVRDLQNLLRKDDVQLFLDGNRRDFSYNGSTGRLVHEATPRDGRHRVKVTATDPQGRSTSKVWTFRML